MEDDQPEFFEGLMLIQEKITPIFKYDERKGTLKRINLVMGQEEF